MFQRPNPPLVTWGIARLALLVTPVGWPSRLADIVGFGALFTWSWLEPLFSSFEGGYVPSVRTTAPT